VRRDWGYVCVIVIAAFAVRVYAPWDTVFAGDRIDFLETDAWYHVRLIENQVRNWPWRITLDPYAAPGGQFVPIAPFFDTLTATLAVVLHGRDADASQIERIAVFVPPLLGALTIVFVWALGRAVFDRRAGLLGAALLAVLPGHFLDRTLLGFYDHHALEACLAMASLYAFARALRRPTEAPGAGVVLGLYLLSWSSGAFLIAVFIGWLLLFALIARSGDDVTTAARVGGVAALVAFVMVGLFQDPGMYRYASQLIALVALAGVALAIRFTAGRLSVSRPRGGAIIGAVVIVGGIAAAVVWWLSPALMTQLVFDIQRLAPDARRMAVLEARPLFLYPGNWHWQQPWDFFRTGFFVGAITLIVFVGQLRRERRAIDLLIWLFTAAMFVATIGQNRFGYYLVPACALLGGWLAARVLDWGGVPHAKSATSAKRPPRYPLQREIAVMLVSAAIFAPNLVPDVLLAERSGSFPAYWHDTMTWLRDHTPPPFAVAAHAGDEYYFARYQRDAVPPPDYSVMTWWDQGYWITQVARRVPVANPTQERAPNAARFYAATDERDAVAALMRERARNVVIDWELPYRLAADATVMGRFQSVLDWAGEEHAKYYQVFYQWDSNAWRTLWTFHEAYYRSMTYRLMVLGGRAAVPNHSTSVVIVSDRQDSGGMRFSEVLSQQTYATYEEAVEAAKRPVAGGRAIVVGLDPWRPAFPVEPLTSLHEVHATRTPEQKHSEAPWVRVFELR
jgi:dolichyl-diphosphooligosaccharide--protein glycosyltransferase